jgi:pimeloyl-ACP methyl ester carboxylesterase
MTARPSLPLALLVALAAACTFTPKPPGAFYSVPGRPTGAPGDVIRHEPIPGAPAGAQAYKVLYISTGLDGQPIAVSGIVIIPTVPAPRGGWDVVAWAHPTTGVAVQCAPSLSEHPFAEMFGIEALLSRGYVVTATDYPGLGTAGPHPYLVGVSEGRAVLDLVRAARRLPGEQIGPRFAVWGHSQGGQAALWAGELAASYAPDLALVGIGAAAPATDLAVLMDDDLNSTAGRVLISYAVWSWSRVYATPVDDILKSSALPVVDEVAAGCILTYGDAFHVALDARPLRSGFLATDPDSVPVWAAIFKRNHLGDEPIAVPMFLAQGTKDPIVRPAVTTALATRLCRRGETVHYVRLEDTGHMGAGQKIAPAMVAWMENRFAGNPAPSDCASLLKAAPPS